MEDQQQILQQVDQYLQLYPNEKAALQSFIGFVNQFEGTQLIDRKNFVGHLTASAFIVHPNAEKLLLLKHKFLNRWLQPGGHIDLSDANVIAAALREAEEETGIPAKNLVPVSPNIFDFDSHPIPENIRKQELPHIHHDCRFLFNCKDAADIQIAVDESADSQWFAFSALEDDAEFGDVIRKISQILKSQKPNQVNG